MFISRGTFRTLRRNFFYATNVIAFYEYHDIQFYYIENGLRIINIVIKVDHVAL